MTPSAITVMLAEEFGWSIEYIASLSRKQIMKLVSGKIEINDLRSKDAKKSAKKSSRVEHKSGGGKVVYENKEINEFHELLNLPGANLTPRLRNFLKNRKQEIGKA